MFSASLRKFQLQVGRGNWLHHDYLKLNAGPIFHFPPGKLWQQKSLRIIHRGCIAKALKHDGLLDWCPPLEEIEWRSEIHAYSFAIGATFGNCDNFSDFFCRGLFHWVILLQQIIFDIDFIFCLGTFFWKRGQRAEGTLAEVRQSVI